MATPKLRFKEFDEDWTALKYEDILNIKYGKDHKKLNSGNIPVFGTGGVMRYVDQFLHDGESILIGRKGTIDSPKYVNEKFWTVDTLFYTEIKEQAVPKFVYQHALQVNWLKLNEATGVPSLNTKSINNVAINLPPLKEQTKIATFLSAVDTKIDELTQKHELLVEYKKGMMQQLFSQKLRFKADDGSDFKDWEERILGNICTTFSGGTPTSSNPAFYEGSIPFIKSGEIAQESTAQFINKSALDNSSAKLVEKGDLLYALYGATSGQVAISQISGAINQAVLCIRSETLDTNYLHNYLVFRKQKIISTYLQGGQGNLSASILKKISIPTPSFKEQTKIANFLTAIDQKIDNVAEQIGHAKTWKKGLLQQMFV